MCVGVRVCALCEVGCCCHAPTPAGNSESRVSVRSSSNTQSHPLGAPGAQVRLRWPQAVIQFEDFETKHAEMLLERYRHTHCCFNDDIQGTSSVAVAAVYGALAVRGHPPEAIVRETFVIQGAGSAGLGVANALVRAMQKHGLSAAAAHERIWLLVTSNHPLLRAKQLAPTIALPPQHHHLRQLTPVVLMMCQLPCKQDSEGLLTSQRSNTAPSVRKFRRQVRVANPIPPTAVAYGPL